MSKEQCAGCRFWLQKKFDPEMGWCLRYPPTPMVNISTDDNGATYSTDPEMVSPSMSAKEWCGEYQPIPPQPGQA